MNNLAFSFAFVVYFVLLFGVTIYSTIRSRGSSDLILGGRSLNFWLTALSAHASDMSSWLFLAFPVSLYVGGMGQCWVAIALVTGMFCNWHFIAPKLRQRTEALDATTISSFFAKRFPEEANSIRATSAIACILFLTYYLSAGMIGVGLVFESLFHIDYMFGLIFATFIVIAYTFLGGFVSVAWADLFQALFLLAVIIIVPLYALFDVGGLSTVTLKMAEAGLSLDLFGPSVSWKEIVYPFFAWGLGYFGMPHIVTKFMAIEKASDLSKSKYVGILWQIISLGASAFCGIVAVAFFNEPLANPELLFIEMAKTLFSPIVLGFAMCGIVAATISTMDSQILVAASLFSEDLIGRLFPERGIRLKNAIFRGCVLVISTVALLFARSKSATIMDTVYYSWAGLGSSFGPLMISSLYSDKITGKGALCGIISGALVSALWPTLNESLTQQGIIDHVPSMIPGFFISLGMIWSVSLLSKVTYTTDTE